MLNKFLIEEYMRRKIGIIGAMQIEIDVYLDALAVDKEVIFSGIRFVTGEIEGQQVVLCVSGIGKVNSAFVTTVLIIHFSVTEIINTGIAGGIGLKLFDIVVADKCCQHDIDTSPLGDPLGYISGGGFDRVFIETDAAMVKELIAALPHAFCGTIATGDVFVATKAHNAIIAERFGAVAVDCESCAILQAATRLGVPTAIIRTISDSADENSAVSYTELANAAALVAKKAVCAYLAEVEEKNKL